MSKDTCSRNLSPPVVSSVFAELGEGSESTRKFISRHNVASDADPVDRIANAVPMEKPNMHYSNVSEQLAVDEHSRKWSTTSNTASNVSYGRRRPNARRRLPDSGNIPPVPGIPQRFLEDKQWDALSDRGNPRRFRLSPNLLQLEEYKSRAPSVTSPVSNGSERLPGTRYNVLRRKICIIGSDGKWHYLNTLNL
jgi:hypothetical protein